MSEQIREQVSAFLDGELPSTETELLLKRLTRDGELRESFGRYALIGEALRGSGSQILSRGFASRVNLAIDGEPVLVHAAAATIQGISCATSTRAVKCAKQSKARNNESASLRPSSPLPGHPFANVENSRCRSYR